MADWQTVVAIACVVLSGLFLARRLVNWLAPGGSDCQSGGCGTCPSNTSSEAQLVQIQVRD